MTDEPSTQQATRAAWIPALSLARPVTIFMLYLAMGVLGLVAWQNIRLELVPSGFTPPFLFVQVPTLRSSAEDIEQRIAIPTEQMLATVRNLRRLGTRIGSGSASFIMEFSDRTDMNDAYNQVRDRMERVLPTVGDDIGQYFIWKYNPADDPVLWFGLTFGPEVEEPGRLINDYYIPRLERIPGVSRVDVSGAPQRVIAIEVDDRLVDAAGTTMPELMTALSRDNFGLSAGVLRPDGPQMPVRVVSRWDSLQTLRGLPVGQGLLLDDIADIVVEDRAERSVYRVNREPSIWLAVYKESTANTVQVVQRVRHEVDTLPTRVPQLLHAEPHYFFDQGDIIAQSLGNLQGAALQGAFFAVLVLFFFLRHVRMTLLVTAAIPLSLLLTLVVMYAAGRTLNVLSLMGLMLVVGMVVDNAIVVVESIQRRRQQGASPDAAAVLGTADVGLAILVSTLTTVVVFLPLILMGGDQMLAFYLGQIGFPVCVGLVASLAVALTLLPLVSKRFVAGRSPEPGRVVRFLEGSYARVLALVLRWRIEAVVLTGLVFASTMIPARQVNVTDQSEPSINDFRVWIDLPPLLPWSERVDVLLAYEEALWSRREALGIRDLVTRMGGRFGRPQVRAFLHPASERVLGREETIRIASEVLPSRPGIRHTLSWDAAAGAQRALTVRVSGPDSRTLAGLAEEVARRIRLLPGVTSVRAESSEDGQPELHLRVDRDRAFGLGLQPSLVGGMVDFALRGRQVGALRQLDGDMPVYLQGRLAATDERDELMRLEIPTATGRVPIGRITDVTPNPGFRGIDREDRRTALSLTIYATREDLPALSREIDEAMRGFAWPRGYGLEKGGRFVDVGKGQQDRIQALLLAITFVFLLMGILFESFLLPLVILFSIPFAFTGVYWMLWATGTSLDIMAGVGLVILVGIVVNNAIVLVDAVEDRRRQGLDRTRALIETGRERLRPILMTALTTIFGLIPMAFGDANLVGIPYRPLGLAVMGGLVASTVLTLVVVPLMYTLLDDVREGARWWAGQAAQRAGTQARRMPVP